MLYNSLVLECVGITSRWVVSVWKVRIWEYKNSVNMKPSPAKSQTLQISSILSCYPVASRPVVKLGLLDVRNRISQTIPCQKKNWMKILNFHDEICFFKITNFEKISRKSQWKMKISKFQFFHWCQASHRPWGVWEYSTMSGGSLTSRLSGGWLGINEKKSNFRNFDFLSKNIFRDKKNKKNSKLIVFIDAMPATARVRG